MSKGLELILEKIKAQPTPTLIGRYLALIAELPRDADKRQRALDLAASLVTAKPSEALRIAHLVHRDDRRDLRALGLMIEALNAKGRFAKAEVLRIERDKLQREQEAAAGGWDHEQATIPLDSLPGEDGEPTPPSHGEARPGVERDGEGGLKADPQRLVFEESRLNFLDLELSQAEDRDLLLHRDHAPEPASAEGPELRLSPKVAAGLFGRAPGDTVLPLRDSLPPTEAPSSVQLAAPLPPLAAPEAGPAAFDLNDPGPAASLPFAASKTQETRIGREHQPAGTPGLGAEGLGNPRPKDALLDRGLGPHRGRGTRRHDAKASAPSQAPASPTTSPAELFDHYWRQGFFAEAGDVLRQCAPAFSREPWWQARQALLASAPQGRGQPGMPPARPSSGRTQRAEPTEFWQPIHTELSRLAREARPLLVPYSRVERLKALLASHREGRKLPVELVRALAELDHRLPGVDAGQLLQLKWDLFQGLWGDEPDAACAALLEELKLTRATPGFWGLYLDALLAARRGRKALVEIRDTLTRQPHLNWARIAQGRLPYLWDQLRLRGFAWREEDGVAALLERLRRRPYPRLTALLALSPTPAARRA